MRLQCRNALTSVERVVVAAACPERSRRVLAPRAPENASKVREQRLVLFVRPNPEPDHHIAVFDQADHAITPSDAGGVNRFRPMNPFEVKAGVMRIGGEKPIGDTSLVTDIRWQSSKALAKGRCGP